MDPLVNQELPSEVTRELIKRSKEAGINISGIISQLQRALADQRIEGNTFNDLVNIHQKLFDAMKLIILPYCFSGVSTWWKDVKVEVGNAWSFDRGDRPIVLTQQGLFWRVREGMGAVRMSDVYYYLYEPMKIVYNLISGLIQTAEANKQEIKGIDDTLRLVKTMSDDVENKESS
jgi:hypothetical protein